MKKLIQTRLHNPPISRGNCLPTVIACFMDLQNPEEVIQVQELYDKEGVDWREELNNWLSERGWEMGSLRGHENNEEYYLVTGVSPRNPNIKHVCIYKNGKLFHDPHPDQTGILTEEYFEYLEKVKSNKTSNQIKKEIFLFIKENETFTKKELFEKLNIKSVNEINISNKFLLELQDYTFINGYKENNLTTNYIRC